MSYKVNTTPRFEKEPKKLIKKYPSLKKETLQLIQLLKQQPDIGIPLGSNVYKIRLGIKSKGSGKSGGGRLITYVIDRHEKIYLLSIFDKSDKENISDKELKEMIKAIDL